MALSPQQRYQQDLRQEGFVADECQARAVEKLQVLQEQLISIGQVKGSLLSRLLGNRRTEPVSGLYFWGGVGRGKTYLMDSFYESLPFQQKMRVHFHRFMRQVHRDLNRLKGRKNPLQLIAADIADEIRVICFDEFFVSDIGDAMILGGLMEQLFARGVTLVATSNITPERLYENGLQRQRFLPVIDLIKTHCEVMNLDGGTDYRLRALTRAEIFHHPSDAGAERNLAGWFADIAPEAGRANEALSIHGRSIRSRRLADGVAWFDFTNLCDGPRSAADYIEIARTHHTVLLSRVPQLTAFHEDAARRFINLVDEFYDRGVKLIIAADVPQADLYTGERSRFEFQRTQSRLTEMQSEEYLARPHLP
ncbi:MAG TPA: cell division protein ZapE [Porticoccaceae bacterium]|nr:cell division protein ZapE [Porticoccaceae bacterium]